MNDYLFGAITLVVMVVFMGLMWMSLHPAEAQSPVDTEMRILDRNDPRIALGLKRYVSMSDCRKDREWIMTLLTRVNASPTWVVCAPYGS